MHSRKNFKSILKIIEPRPPTHQTSHGYIFIISKYLSILLLQLLTGVDVRSNSPGVNSSECLLLSLKKLLIFLSLPPTVSETVRLTTGFLVCVSMSDSENTLGLTAGLFCCDEERKSEKEIRKILIKIHFHQMVF